MDARIAALACRSVRVPRKLERSLLWSVLARPQEQRLLGVLPELISAVGAPACPDNPISAVGRLGQRLAVKILTLLPGDQG